MREQPYDAENVLQALIAEHPEILGEDETGTSSEWLLVKEEAGIPDAAEGVERWSLDHLFLDRAGVPTLVEVKRRQDARLRREVVAQMLEYAANGVAYWSADVLRGWFETTSGSQTVAERRLEAFGIADIDGFWETVKTNLEAARIRLVLVADEVPRELRSILEYLNRQMSQTEVFAIEVKQYVDAAGERQTIVPRVIGRPEGGKPSTTRQWDEPSLLADIRGRVGERAAAAAQKLITWASSRDDLLVRYGKGAHYATAQVRPLRDGDVLPTMLYIQSIGTVYIVFSNLPDLHPFDERDKRDELRARIRAAVPGADIPDEDLKIDPTIPLDTLGAPETLSAFVAAMNWAFDEARRDLPASAGALS
jgi:hypothetical protein